MRWGEREGMSRVTSKLRQKLRRETLLLILTFALLAASLSFFFMSPGPIWKEVKTFKGYEDLDWIVVDESGKVIGHIKKPVYDVEYVYNWNPMRELSLFLALSAFTTFVLSFIMIGRGRDESRLHKRG